MGKSPTIEIEQIKQEIDLLISQLLTFKATVLKIGDNLKGVCDAAPGNGQLTDAQVAALLNKRERALQKRIDRLTNHGIKQ